MSTCTYSAHTTISIGRRRGGLVDVPLGFVSTVGIPGFVILTLVSILGFVVRAIFKGELVPRRYYDIEVQRGDEQSATIASLTEQLRELITDKDLGLHILTGIRAKADAARSGDEP